MDHDFSIYWDNICQIYFLTKHYLLLAEELSEGFDTFIQPLKEERDAFDHIARVYGHKYLTRKVDDINNYCASNMRKAVQHVYRAFFDTADFFSYVCQKQIREQLRDCGKTYGEIKKLYPRYDNAKSRLESLPLEITKIRENKDESESDAELVEEVLQYKKVLDEVYDIYLEINRIIPKT